MLKTKEETEEKWENTELTMSMLRAGAIYVLW